MAKPCTSICHDLRALGEQTEGDKFPDQIAGRHNAGCLRNNGFWALPCSAQRYGGSATRFATKLSSRTFLTRQSAGIAQRRARRTLPRSRVEAANPCRAGRQRSRSTVSERER